MKNNTYFDEMYRIGHEWSEKHDAHEKLKKEIIKTKGWDSPELEAWYAEEEKMKFPFSSGANKAYRAWRYSQGDEVVMEDFCWTAERHDFIDTLRFPPACSPADSRFLYLIEKLVASFGRQLL